jgi:hypothetical protein
VSGEQKRKDEAVLSEEEFVEEVRRRIAEFGSLVQASKEPYISTEYLSLVGRGLRRPGPAFVKGMGFERVTVYRRVK